MRVDVSGLGSQVLSIRNEILSTHLTLKVQLTDQQQNVLAEGQGSGLRYNAVVNSNGMLFPTIAPALNSVLVRVQRQGFNGEVRSSVQVESVDLASATQSARNHDIFHFSVASAYLMVAIFFAVLTLALSDRGLILGSPAWAADVTGALLAAVPPFAAASIRSDWAERPSFESASRLSALTAFSGRGSLLRSTVSGR